MANHRAAAALLLVASIFVMVAISRADARLTMGPNKMAALSHDSHGRGFMADVVASRQPKPTCDNCEQPEPEPEPKPKPEPEPKPKPEPEPEPKPELTCNKVHGVQAEARHAIPLGRAPG
ncbi:hypothetical protein SORBI_3005G197800 [Sorghum bicolor]|uniref:Uncharacterized protein n=1 Tax=Sorghum bicolor TaxID=4558 RepID=A0A1Z5RJY6_SORBI|nr:hypothetical protein SORBI_3005G197800 [Sorghum bicolor]